MTNDQKKQILLDLIKMEEDSETFNFTRAERAEFQKWINGLIEKYEESRWIPVSERLPDDYEEVIASVDHEYVYPESRYSKEFGWEWAAESSYDYWTDLNGVDAWMPLPKAYKIESEEKDDR